MSDTPRTDAEEAKKLGGWSFARTLERELAAVTRERDEARDRAAEQTERTETAQEECERWREITNQELESSLHLMALGGADEDENFYDFATRVFAERDALRAEVERLRGALNNIVEYWAEAPSNGPTFVEIAKGMEAIARAALQEPTP